MPERYIGYTAREYDSKATRRNMIRSQRASDGARYCEGVVETEWGFVHVYSQGIDGKSTESTHYTFIWDGRRYDRAESRARTLRSLATEAARFAGRIVDGAQ